MGFNDHSLSYDLESQRITIFIPEENEWFKEFLPDFIFSLERLATTMVKKTNDDEAVFLDINNYRRERESVILEMAKAAARKAVATKEKIALPPMNAYERRLVHLEISSRPDLTTESHGLGKDRYVVVKVIE